MPFLSRSTIKLKANLEEFLRKLQEMVRFGEAGVCQLLRGITGSYHHFSECGDYHCVYTGYSLQHAWPPAIIHSLSSPSCSLSPSSPWQRRPVALTHHLTKPPVDAASCTGSTNQLVPLCWAISEDAEPTLNGANSSNIARTATCARRHCGDGEAECVWKLEVSIATKPALLLQEAETTFPASRPLNAFMLSSPHATGDDSSFKCMPERIWFEKWVVVCWLVRTRSRGYRW